ncbi:hypothetical protein Lal_00050187 [Lupinus albus]|nr:hypothetical protein Lal_00050187 [Lupinus albus]
MKGEEYSLNYDGHIALTMMANQWGVTFFCVRMLYRPLRDLLRRDDNENRTRGYPSEPNPNLTGKT